jgi:hypothetical protein
MYQDVKAAKGFKKKWFYIFGSPLKIYNEKIARKREKEMVSDSF